MNLGPFLRSSNSVSKMMRNLLLSLIPIIIFNFYKNGIMPYIKGDTTSYGFILPILFVLIGSFTSYITEALYLKYVLKREHIKQILKKSYAIFPGLFLSFILPIDTPIPILILGSMAATICGKMIWGGFGRNFLNPALVGLLLVGIIFNKIELNPFFNGYALKTIGSYDTLIAPYGNLWNFFTGVVPSMTAASTPILCILVYLFLSYKRVIKWKIPIFYLVTIFLMTWIIGNAHGLGIWYPLFHILSGSLIFTSIFIATDPITSPVTSIGQIIYSVLLGILTVSFRFLTPFQDGAFISILIMNLFVIFLDKLGSYGNLAIRKLIIPLFICGLFGSFITLHIIEKYENKETVPVPIEENINLEEIK